MEMLFVATQADPKELFEVAVKVQQSDKKRGNFMAKWTSETYFDDYIGNLVAQLYARSPTLQVMPDVEDHLKQFLMKPSILDAIIHCLDEVVSTSSKSITVTVEGVKKLIGEMRIHIVHEFGPFCGIVVRDGILLFLARRAPQVVVDGGNAIWKAQVYALVVDECMHFSARAFFDDYAFCSPSKYLPPGQSLRDDGVIPGKLLELGRKVELRLFGGVQPSWPESEEAAAEKFIECALSSELHASPLIAPSEHAILGLAERECVSVSMAGELDLDYLADPFRGN